LARSDDGGKTWSQSSTPIDTSGKAFYPRIAWGKGRSLTVVWNDERRSARAFDVYSRRSTDSGATWEPEQLVSHFADSSKGELHARPELVGDGQDKLWVVWVGVRRGRDGLYLGRSMDGGRSWTEPVLLSGDGKSVFRHILARVGEHLLLVWQDARTGQNRIYAVSSGNDGATWTSPVRVDHVAADSAANATAPAVLLDKSGEAVVAWQDERNGRDDVFVARSPDWGKSWGNEDQRMDTDEPGTGFSRYPRLAAAADGRVALVWEDDRNGLEQIYLRVRGAGDRPDWGRETVVTPPAQKKGSRLPQLIWGPDGLLYIAWEAWDYTLAPSRTMRQVEAKALQVDSH
jgi:hypothetical protein